MPCPFQLKSRMLCYRRDARLVRPISRQAKKLNSEASRSSKYSRKTILTEKSRISGIPEYSHKNNLFNILFLTKQTNNPYLARKKILLF